MANIRIRPTAQNEKHLRNLKKRKISIVLAWRKPKGLCPCTDLVVTAFLAYKMLVISLLLAANAAAPTNDFNCFTRERWSQEKSVWCCEVRGIGCPGAAKTDCDSIKDQKDCDSAGCSWCKAGAVPDSCKTIEEAKQLPPAVFQCDKVSKVSSTKTESGQADA